MLELITYWLAYFIVFMAAIAVINTVRRHIH
jgi:hypothetical protein